VRTRVEGSIAKMITPVAAPTLDATIAQGFGNTVMWTGGGRSPVRFGINWPMTFGPAFNRTAVGACVELLHEGAVARRLNVWWIGGSDITDQQRNYGFEINYENLDLLRTLAPDQDGWTLRVRGDPMLALRAGTPKQYWQGEINLPVNLRLSSRVAPPKMWWVEGEAGPMEPIDMPADSNGRRRGRRSF